MNIVDLFATSPAWFITTLVIFTLLIGSFLNVVIHRLPIMLDRDWRKQSQELLASPSIVPSGKALPEKYNIVVPRSACPNCGTQITALQNIPVISWLLLKGRCAKCQTKISVRYPLVEATTALLSVIVTLKLGFTVQTAAALVLTWSLLALSLIDFDHQILPDQITLPLLWVGLLLAAIDSNILHVTMHDAIFGAAFGYLSLWLVYHIFKLVTGKEGMGYGDFKLLAALGAWMGWKMLPVIILFSSFSGAVIGIALILFRGRDHNIPIPFGPYLAAAGWIAMLWGNDIVGAYMGMLHVQ
ncbi:MAG TPA: A24 family peptidase [Steroidobacteraceae bacterium]|nr:A24 family peptidase [Steroidobacteraceae bacterium]